MFGGNGFQLTEKERLFHNYTTTPEKTLSTDDCQTSVIHELVLMTVNILKTSSLPFFYERREIFKLSLEKTAVHLNDPVACLILLKRTSCISSCVIGWSFLSV